jgi:hypothetical protein
MLAHAHGVHIDLFMCIIHPDHIITEEHKLWKKYREKLQTLVKRDKSWKIQEHDLFSLVCSSCDVAVVNAVRCDMFWVSLYPRCR